MANRTYSLDDFVVYAHCCDGDIIYVGSGGLSRAYYGYSRHAAWREAVAGRKVDVVILSVHSDRRAAFVAEREHIRNLQPKGNVVDNPAASIATHPSGLKKGRPRKTGNPPTPVRVVSHPVNRAFYSLRDAALFFNISPAAVSYSIKTGEWVKKVDVVFRTETAEAIRLSGLKCERIQKPGAPYIALISGSS